MSDVLFRITMLKGSRYMLMVIAAAILTGCATKPTYHATATSKKTGAIVTGWTWKTWKNPIITIDQVDGVNVSGWENRYPLLVDPGLRTFGVTGWHCPFGQLLTDAAHVEIQANLQAGKVYRIKLVCDCKNHLMTFWMEDDKSHVAVTEKQSTNTVHAGDSGIIIIGPMLTPMR